ncbi:MAG: hypothetical protein HDR80_08555 [Bacteroides sp.]|nr:hypothetical protein [Bacteroides sp.]
MYTKGNTLYASAYRYLKHRRLNAVTLQTTVKHGDYEEEEMRRPLDVRIRGKEVIVNGWFIFRPKKWDYASLKTFFVKLRYTNDDQMAIILNKDASEEKHQLYEEMQVWREFAAEVARGVIGEG